MKETIEDIIKEKEEMCTKLLIIWNFNQNKKVHDEELVEKLFTAKVLLKKLEVFNIDVFVPDELLGIISVCVDDNPGMSQVILKKILNNVKMRKGSVPVGYCILPEDFSLTFPLSFPIQEKEEEDIKLYELWNSQKPNGINLCDTREWWEEIFNG